MKKYYILFDNDRIGDRIAILYFASNFRRDKEKELNEKIYLVALENFWHYPYLDNFSMNDWGNDIFDDVVTFKNKNNWNSHIKKLRNDGYECPSRNYWKSDKFSKEHVDKINGKLGNLWTYTPSYVRDFNIYPSLIVPKIYDDWVKDQYSNIVKLKK